ncbi:uncharacterized protein G2W53_001366 [Senna tora]|uniref:Uncharacterized protein n=1 Tax=Senna tora TaxID=362788 RepID=A0A834XIK8_9FABA|nr:uncharacterized protein G2W53_001366 [Senna tora]
MEGVSSHVPIHFELKIAIESQKNSTSTSSNAFLHKRIKPIASRCIREFE